MPLTFFLLLLVPEGSGEEIEEVPDDAEALLEEIRRERRSVSDHPSTEELPTLPEASDDSPT